LIKTVYISSTFKDLIDEREAAAQAVRRLGHHALAMEDYVATDTRPLAKCIADVESSDVYIGIFARRYGYIPDGYEKSITQMEYEAARRKNIPCLIFQLHRSVDWPKDKLGDEYDFRRISEFRDQLGNDHIVSFFNSPEELGGLVSAAVSNTIRSNGSTHTIEREIPALLPYLSDRSHQKFMLADALRPYVESDSQRSDRPLICFIHGSEMECHHWFLERLQKVMLPGLLRLPDHAGLVAEHQLGWPPPDMPANGIGNFLLANLGDNFCRNSYATAAEVQQKFISMRTPILLYSVILTQDWEENGEVIAEKHLEFWNDWPDNPGHPVVCCIMAKYKDPAGEGFFRRRKINNTNKSLCEYLEKLDFTKYPGINGIVLPELVSLQRQDVEEWAGSREVKEICNWQGLLKDVKALYDNPEIAGKEGHICMEHLGEELSELLEKHKY